MGDFVRQVVVFRQDSVSLNLVDLAERISAGTVRPSEKPSHETDVRSKARWTTYLVSKKLLACLEVREGDQDLGEHGFRHGFS